MMMIETYPDIVSKAVNAVFNSCPTVVKNDILNHLTVKEVDKNTTVIQEGQPCNGIYIIAKGSLKLFLKKGKNDQILLFKTVNDLIGIQCALDNVNFKYSVSALEDSILIFIPSAQLEKILTTYPTLFFSLIRKVNENAVAVETRSSLMMSDSAEKVVMKTMEDLKNTFGTDGEGYINIQIPVKDLASYICMSKTNLYRVLNTLKEKTFLTHQLDRYRLLRNIPN